MLIILFIALFIYVLYKHSHFSKMMKLKKEIGLIPFLSAIDITFSDFAQTAVQDKRTIEGRSRLLNESFKIEMIVSSSGISFNIFKQGELSFSYTIPLNSSNFEESLDYSNWLYSNIGKNVAKRQHDFFLNALKHHTNFIPTEDKKELGVHMKNKAKSIKIFDKYKKIARTESGPSFDCIINFTLNDEFLFYNLNFIKDNKHSNINLLWLGLSSTWQLQSTENESELVSYFNTDVQDLIDTLNLIINPLVG